MWRTALTYGAAFGLLIIGVKVLSNQHALQRVSSVEYGIITVIGFLVLGSVFGWRYRKLSGRAVANSDVPPAPKEALSPREQEVLQYLAQGLSNQEIASTLFVSQNTVKTHVKKVYHKLQVHRRTQAVSRAKALNLVP
ncbi:MAG: response regulator transcription factor [Bacteroidota bacterium]